MTDHTRRKFVSPEAFRRSLEHQIQSVARERGQDLQRARRKVAFERMLARLYAHRDGDWVLKGGYAMELRFPVARATRDIDLTVFNPVRLLEGNDPYEAIHRALRKAVAIDLNDYFEFDVAEFQVPLEGPIYGGARFAVEAAIGERQFDRFSVDVALDTNPERPLETLTVDGWLSPYGYPPVSCCLINLEQQFAEKLHAYTLPRPDEENSRVKDLIDLVLLAECDRIKQQPLTEAIQRVFDKRSTHPLPDFLPAPPTAWKRPFALLAEECDIDLSMDEAIEFVREYMESCRSLILHP